VTIGLPPPEDRALSDVWSALGGELKPSLDLVISTPVDVERFVEAATLVDMPPRFNWSGAGDEPESVMAAPGSDGSSEVSRVMRISDLQEEASVKNGKK
jgi:hypothetical protein